MNPSRQLLYYNPSSAGDQHWPYLPLVSRPSPQVLRNLGFITCLHGSTIHPLHLISQSFWSLDENWYYLITIPQIIIYPWFLILIRILQGRYYDICFGDEDIEVLRGPQPVSGRIIWTRFVWFQTVNHFHYPMMCLRLSKLTLLVSAGAEGGEQFSSVPEWNLEFMPEIIL